MKTGTDEVIEYTPLPIKVEGYDDKNIISLQADASVGTFRYLALVDQNFKVARHDFRIEKDTTIELHLPETSFLGLTFTVGNDITCRMAGQQKITSYHDQFQFIFCPFIRVQYLFKKGEHTTFSIEIDRAYFTSLTAHHPLFRDFEKSMAAGKPSFIHPNGIYGSIEMTRIISKIMVMMENRSPDRILLEAKTRELIWLFIQRVQSDKVGQIIPLDLNEQEAIQKACDYLLGNLDRHINISDAADKFGISEKKLSKVFKARNEIDLYKFILKERMELAMHWLRQGKSVKETAKLTGYPDQQNLSVAFRKFFGRTPSSVLRSQHNRGKGRRS